MGISKHRKKGINTKNDLQVITVGLIPHGSNFPVDGVGPIMSHQSFNRKLDWPGATLRAYLEGHFGD